MSEAYQMPHIERVMCYSFRHFDIPEEVNRIRLFHGTSTVFLPKILDRGLVNCVTSGEMIDDGDWASEPCMVYLGHQYRCLCEYAARTVRKKGGERILVEVEIPVDSRIEEDREEIRGYFTNWKQSLEHFLICSYRGNLTPEHTRAIHFFAPWVGSVKHMQDGNPEFYKKVVAENFEDINIDEILKQLDLAA